jgi:hypothetical protein
MSSPGVNRMTVSCVCSPVWITVRYVSFSSVVRSMSPTHPSIDPPLASSDQRGPYPFRPFPGVTSGRRIPPEGGRRSEDLRQEQLARSVVGSVKKTSGGASSTKTSPSKNNTRLPT